MKTEGDSGDNGTAVLDGPPPQSEDVAVGTGEDQTNATEGVTAIQQASQPSEVDELRRKLADVTTQLDAKNRHELQVLRLERVVAERESIVDSLKEELKAAKESFDEAVSELRFAIRRRDDQKELPFTGDVATSGATDTQAQASTSDATGPQLAKLDDPAGNTPLSQIGLTSNQCEKLMSVDPAIETVAQLESFIAAGKFVPKSIKGIGDKALETISDKLLAFRQEHPNPNDRPAPAVDGEWDPTQYHAGQIAYAEGKAAADNPNPALSHAHESWFAGWRKKQEDSKQFRAMTPAQAIAECQAIQNLAINAGEPGKEIHGLACDAETWIRDHQEVLDKHYASFESWRAKLATIVPAKSGKRQESPERKAYREGCEAALAGSTECPYPANDQLGKMWMNGFQATMDSSVQDQPQTLWEQSIQTCDEIVEVAGTIDKPDAHEFISSVLTQLEDVRTWILDNEHVTEDQLTAIANWKSGIEKWI